MATGTLLRTLDLHEPESCSLHDDHPLAFLPGGRLLFCLCRKLWTWSPDREEPERFPDRRSERALVFDSGVVTHEEQGSRITIWDAEARTILRTIDFPGVELARPAVSPCGRFFACLSKDLRCRIVRLSEGSIVSEFSVPRFWHTPDLSFSRSGSLVGYAGQDEAPMVFETATGRRVAALGRPKHSSVGFGAWYHERIRFHCENRAITAGTDGTARFWRLPGGQEELLLTAPGVPPRETLNPGTGRNETHASSHAGWIREIAVAPSGEVVASAGDDHVVRLWDTRTGMVLRSLGEPRNTIRALTLQGDRIASGHEDGTVRVWDVRTRRLVGESTGHTGGVNGLAFVEEGYLASGGSDGFVRFWKVPALESLGTCRLERGSIQELAMSADGVTLAIGGWRERDRRATRTGAAVLLNVRTRQPGPPIEAWGEVPTRTCGGWWHVDAVAMHPSGKLLATAVGCEIRLWHTETGAPAATLVTRRSFGGDITSMAFSPDGKRLVAGTVGCSVFLWETGTLGLVLQFRAQRDCAGAIAFTPDGGSLIVLTNYDNTVWIHDASTGTLVDCLHAHRSSLRALAISGNLLATGGQDGSIQLWSAGCWKNLGSIENAWAGRPERDSR